MKPDVKSHMDPRNPASESEDRPAPALAKLILAAAPFVAILLVFFLNRWLSR